MSFAAISTAMDSATTYLIAGNYALARDYALKAQALASILPDTTRSTGGGGSQGLTWDRVAITTFLDRVQRLLNSSAGIQVTKICTQPVDGTSPSQIGIW